MDSETIKQRQIAFDDFAQRDEDGVEFWSARDLMQPLGYARWENFETAVKRAVNALESEKIPVQAHFREATKMVQLGSGSTRSRQTSKVGRTQTSRRNGDIQAG